MIGDNEGNEQSKRKRDRQKEKDKIRKTSNFIQHRLNLQNIQMHALAFSKAFKLRLF